MAIYPQAIFSSSASQMGVVATSWQPSCHGIVPTPVIPLLLNWVNMFIFRNWPWGCCSSPVRICFSRGLGKASMRLASSLSWSREWSIGISWPPSAFLSREGQLSHFITANFKLCYSWLMLTSGTASMKSSSQCSFCCLSSNVRRRQKLETIFCTDWRPLLSRCSRDPSRVSYDDATYLSGSRRGFVTVN
jgi:hypothetical protein